jgi:osmotically-inducible protein OsmY
MMMRFAFTVLLMLVALVIAAPVAAGKDDPVSDDLIYDQVRRRLANDPDVKGGTFEVAVKDGVVTIKGVVERDKFKSKAEKLAKKVKGVRQVVNQLTVAPR